MGNAHGTARGSKMIFEEQDRREFVPIFPSGLHGNLANEAFLTLQRLRLGVLDQKTGLIDCAFKNFELIEDGRIFPSNPFVYQEIHYTCIQAHPEIGDLVRAQIMNLTMDGAFATDGIFEYFIHRSQLSRKFVEFDQGRMEYRIKENDNAYVRIGSVILGRLVSISYLPKERRNQLSLTLRQEGLQILHL